jgi:hypothetical protein
LRRVVPDGTIPRVGTSLGQLPAVAWILLFVILGGIVMAIANLRNAGIWLLQANGRRAEGVVESVEFVTGENFEPMRRPVVAFTTEDGQRIVTKPALYRTATHLAKGMTVPVRYAAGRPDRIVVPGFGIRLREPVLAAIGTAVAVGVSSLYFFG